MRDWRNIQSLSIECNSQFVVFHGDNGAGKTNVLEAVYMLSSLRSFRDAAKNHLVRHGSTASLIEATIRSPYGRKKISWSYSSRGRELRMDNAPVSSISQWFVPIRAILFCPDHSAIVRGGPDARRRFLDRARFTANPAYLDVYRKYHHILGQKKSLLRGNSSDPLLLKVWNQQLVDYGVKISLQRQSMLSELQQPFAASHGLLTGGEGVGLSLKGLSGRAPEEVRGFFESELERLSSEESRQGRCLVGPHRDDVVIEIDGYPARRFASQGQTRSIVISLKMAELEAARLRGESPLFLLDDLSSELDRERTHRLVDMLAQRDNQIWITTTNLSLLGTLPSSSTRRFHLSSGQLGDC
jgi:DNA replication and repair protein RecF